VEGRRSRDPEIIVARLWHDRSAQVLSKRSYSARAFAGSFYAEELGSSLRNHETDSMKVHANLYALHHACLQAIRVSPVPHVLAQASILLGVVVTRTRAHAGSLGMPLCCLLSHCPGRDLHTLDIRNTGIFQRGQKPSIF
jgi:hypothetical protein